MERVFGNRRYSIHIGWINLWFLTMEIQDIESKFTLETYKKSLWTKEISSKLSSKLVKLVPITVLQWWRKEPERAPLKKCLVLSCSLVKWEGRIRSVFPKGLSSEHDCLPHAPQSKSSMVKQLKNPTHSTSFLERYSAHIFILKALRAFKLMLLYLNSHEGEPCLPRCLSAFSEPLGKGISLRIPGT